MEHKVETLINEVKIEESGIDDGPDYYDTDENIDVSLPEFSNPKANHPLGGRTRLGNRKCDQFR